LAAVCGVAWRNGSLQPHFARGGINISAAWRRSRRSVAWQSLYDRPEEALWYGGTAVLYPAKIGQ